MKIIALTKGLSVQVDDEDYDYLNQWKWFAKKRKHTYYAVRNTARIKGKRKMIMMHRLIISCEGSKVEFIDNNGLNNQKSNLKIVQKKDINESKLRQSITQKRYQELHKEELKIYWKKYHAEYYNKNKESIKKSVKKYVFKNIEKKRIYHKNYKKRSRVENPQVKVRENISRRISSAIKSGYKSESAVKLIGCSINKLMIHLESKFKEGMSWSNYGKNGWHIHFL